MAHTCIIAGFQESCTIEARLDTHLHIVMEYHVMIEAKFDTHIVRDAKGLHFPKQNNKTTTKPFVDQIFPFANNNTIQNNIQKNLKIFSEK